MYGKSVFCTDVIDLDLYMDRYLQGRSYSR